MRCAAHAWAAVRAVVRPLPNHLNPPPLCSRRLPITDSAARAAAASLTLPDRSICTASRSHRPQTRVADAPAGDCAEQNPRNGSLQKQRRLGKNMPGRTRNVFAEVGVVHSNAVKLGLHRHPVAGTQLMSRYTKAGCLEAAHKLFGEMTSKNAAAWTVLIAGFSGAGLYAVALDLFAQMLREGVLPNRVTLPSVFKCYASTRDLGGGKEVHGWLLRNVVAPDVVLENSLLDLYAKCGDLVYAGRVFYSMAGGRDGVSWNVMLGAYLQAGDVPGSIELFKRSPYRDVASWNTMMSGQLRNGFHAMALETLYQMVQLGPPFSPVTFSVALALAGALSLPGLGRQIHCKLVRSETWVDGFVRNSLVDMYCKCGKMESASAVFSRVSCGGGGGGKARASVAPGDGGTAETVSRSCMVSGYVHGGRHDDALEFFRGMFREGAVADSFSVASIISACSRAGLLAQGKQVHACAEKLGYLSSSGDDVYLSSAMVDMYAKCGSLHDAEAAFREAAASRGGGGAVVLWTSMIGAYAAHGRGREAVGTFEAMLEERVRPNGVTFVRLLSACSHAGLVGEGCRYLGLMREGFGLVPTVGHLTCVVDLLGRAGLLREARDLIRGNDDDDAAAAWKALLSACRFHGASAEAAAAAASQQLAAQLGERPPCDIPGSLLLLLSHVCSAAGRWAEASELRRIMREEGIGKQPGVSWIQLESGGVHTFAAGDRSHPQTDRIYSYLGWLTPSLTEMGVSADCGNRHGSAPAQ